MRLDQITVASVERFRDDRRRTGLSPQTVNKLLTTIAAIFKFANRKELIDRNPAGIAERLRSGARIGELTALAWADVDLDGRTLTIRRNLSSAPPRAESKGLRPRFFEPKTRVSRRTLRLPPRTRLGIEALEARLPAGALRPSLPRCCWRPAPSEARLRERPPTCAEEGEASARHDSLPAALVRLGAHHAGCARDGGREPAGPLFAGRHVERLFSLVPASQNDERGDFGANRRCGRFERGW